MHYCSRVEGRDSNWRLNSLPAVTGEAEPKEGGWIALTWIVVDPKIYPENTMSEGIAVAAGSDVVSFSTFCCKYLMSAGVLL